MEGMAQVVVRQDLRFVADSRKTLRTFETIVLSLEK